MGTPFEVQVTIRGGFPLVVRGEVSPAEADVGLSTRLEDLDIRTTKGTQVSWLKISRNEIFSIEEQVWDRLRHD